MAEILNSGVNHYFKDVATSGGNTIIGAAAPTDVNAQGISKEAGETGVFVYTDKSFTVYMCYGSTWAEYMAVDSTDADFDNAVSIPWASHDTHGAATAMYFVTAEADHEIRAVKIFNHLITDFIPSDSDFQKNALIESDSTVSTSGSGVLAGSKIHYSPDAHNLAGKAAGETFSYVLNGLVGGALTFMDGYTQVKTTIAYDAETGKSTISFIIPAGYNGSQVFKTHTKGGSPLSDPFTRSVTIPTSNLQIYLKPEGTEGAGVSTHTNYGSGADLPDGTSQGKYRALQVTKWDYVASSFGLVDTYIPSVDWSHNSSGVIPKPYTTEINNGLTVVTPVYLTSNYSALVGDKLFYQLANNDDWTLRSTETKSVQVIFKDNDGSGNWNLQINLAQTSPWGTGAKYETSGYPVQAHAWNVILFQWDGDTNSAPILKINGVAIELTQTDTSCNGHEANSLDFGFGVPVSVGEVAIYESALSGTDLEQLEAYFDFKYINYSDSEVMFNEANWKNIMAKTIGNPPGGTSTSITGYDNAQTSYLVRTEKMIKVGSRAEIKYSISEYGYNKPNQLIITEDLEWQSKNDQYGYYQTDIKNTSAAYLIKSSMNYLYLYYSDGAGNMPLVYNANTGLSPTDEISLIVEWDGTVKLGLNGTVLYTATDKFTVGNHIAPFIWSQRKGEASLTIDGNLVDFAWPSNYSSEVASNATPVYESGNAVITDNHINHGSNPMSKGGKVKVGTLQGEGAYIDWQPHPFHGSNRYIMTLSTTADVWSHTDANAEIAMRAAYVGTQQYVYTSGSADHLMTRQGLGGFTSWADYYNDISNSYEGDTDINKYGFGRMRIQFYDDHVIFWGNGYPIYRVDGIDTSQQYYVNIDMNDITWSPGFEDIKIYNP